MSFADLQKTIDSAWDSRDSLGVSTKGAVREAVEAALDALDAASCASPRRPAASGRSTSG